MTERQETAEETLERIRAADRAASKRYREKHPDRIRALERARRNGGKRLREAHRSEYDGLLLVFKAQGHPCAERHRLSLAELRRRFDHFVASATRGA